VVLDCLGAQEAPFSTATLVAFRRRLIAQRYRQDSEQVYGTQLAKVRLRAGVVAVLDVIPNATLAVVLLLGALSVGSGRLTPPCFAVVCRSRRTWP